MYVSADPTAEPEPIAEPEPEPTPGILGTIIKKVGNSAVDAIKKRVNQ